MRPVRKAEINGATLPYGGSPVSRRRALGMGEKPSPVRQAYNARPNGQMADLNQHKVCLMPSPKNKFFLPKLQGWD